MKNPHMRLRYIEESILNDINHEVISNNGLFTGRSGQILFKLTLGANQSNSKLINDSMQLLRCVLMENSELNRMPIGICSGISGIAWLCNHIESKWGYIEDSNTILRALDNRIEKQLQFYLQNGYWDYLHGYSGVGVYFVDRCNHNLHAENVLDLIINTLSESIEKIDKYYSWRVNIGKPNRYCNISLSHGVSGILGFLNKCSNKYKHNKLNYLIDICIDYLLSEKYENPINQSYFPTFSKMDKIFSGSRLGWCYGDLGISWILLNSGI